MRDCIQEFRQGVEAGYALAIEDLQTAIESGAIHKKNNEGVAVLVEWSLDCADRWIEDSEEERR